MLVDVTLGEEKKLELIRSSENYVQGSFADGWRRHRQEMSKILEAAKVYITDNYKKISDWMELSFLLYGYGKNSPIHFGTKDAERKKRHPALQKAPCKTKIGEERLGRMKKALERINKEKIPIKTFDEAVYDWTDGDFSVTINGKDYMWIDHHNPSVVIDIAEFISKKLSEQTK